MTERCIKWNVMCKFSNKLTYGVNCPLDNKIPCNEEVIKARKRFLRLRQIDRGEGKNEIIR
jgi:hypothetical protein